MNDERLKLVQKEKEAAINQSNQTYDNMLQDSQNLLNQQTSYADEYQKVQQENLDKQLGAYQKRIDTQKEQAQATYEEEAKKAKNDFVSYTNPYGYQAETLGAQGQARSGLTQTNELGGYNTYQNRVAAANKALQSAITQYDLDINDAIANNDVRKAEAALKALELKVGYQSEYTKSKQSISQNKLSNGQSLDSEYNNRYENVVKQINTEKEQAEAIRQFNEKKAYQKERDKVADKQWEKEYALSKSTAAKRYGSSSSSGGAKLTNGGGLSDSNSSNIVTDYYKGKINPDCQYGTFGTKDKNGVNYQPNNVGGEPLSSSGKKVSDFFGTGNKGKTGANIDNQTVWKTSSGDYYVWDGSQNKYIQVNTKTFSISYNEDYGSKKKVDKPFATVHFKKSAK